MVKKISDIYKSDFEIYQCKIRTITRQLKSELFEKWNGYDYYDDEYIKNNLELEPGNSLYPTVDHKISIFSGFRNNISINDMTSLDNLCITKRCINSSKNIKNEDDFEI